MDYGKFIEAIKNDSYDDKNFNYKEIFDILCGYLTTTMKANADDAEDCAQHVLIKTYERIKDNVANEPANIYSYLIKSAKNRYLRLLFERNRCQPEDNIEEYLPVVNPVDALVKEEEQMAFEECLAELPEKMKVFISYFLEYPQANASDVASHFNMSVNNVWIKKHRILKKLAVCVRNKVEKKV